MSDLSKKSRRMACPRCKAPMDAVVEIQPLIHEAGLIAYECPACLYVTSILWHPGERASPNKSPPRGRHALGWRPPRHKLYNRRMPLPPGFVPPCLPTKATQPPTGEAWLHEIKHDGFRVIARKNGHRVRFYSRPGNDGASRFTLIVEARARLRWRFRRHNGKAVCCYDFRPD